MQPSINLVEFRTFCATKVCLFSTHHSQIIPFSSSYFNHGQPTCHFVENFLILVFSYSFISQAAFGAFSFFFSLTTLETPEIHFHILAAISLLHFQTYWENTHRSECWESTGKHFACNVVVERVADQGLLLQ